jgi:large subunit ribosomal protein L4
MANGRQGTHKSKQRNEISGSTKKLKKQKGTGTARAGSIKSPVFRGGGRIFGPQPRDYSFKLNKKVKDLARNSALTLKAQNNGIVVVEGFNFEKPSTKGFNTILDNLKISGTKTLVIIPELNENVYLSSRNIQKSKVVVAAEINTYDILNAKNIVLFENSLKTIENLLTQN